MDAQGSATRFRNPVAWLGSLTAGDIGVVCPRCAGRAVVTARPVEGVRVMSWPRRCVCTACVWSASWSPRDGVTSGDRPVDLFFRLPLWLQAECCGSHVLWAFNDAHLELLEDYVGARLRERVAPGMTLPARLPGWLKSAKNRAEVLRTIARLRS